MKFSNIAIMLILAATLSACCGCRSGKSRSVATITGADWHLTQLDGLPMSPVADQYVINLSDDGRITGVGNCNRLTGSYNTNNDGMISLSQVASTRMLCLDQATEDKFMQALNRVNGYAVDGNNLMLMENNRTIMVFTKTY